MSLKDNVSYEVTTKIVGVTMIKGAQNELKKLHSDEKLILEVEPMNSYDSNAVMVLNKDSVKLGYIPATTAKKINSHVLNSNALCFVNRVTGGTYDKEFIGCTITIKINI